MLNVKRAPLRPPRSLTVPHYTRPDKRDAPSPPARPSEAPPPMPSRGLAALWGAHAERCARPEARGRHGTWTRAAESGRHSGHCGARRKQGPAPVAELLANRAAARDALELRRHPRLRARRLRIRPTPHAKAHTTMAVGPAGAAPPPHARGRSGRACHLRGNARSS